MCFIDATSRVTKPGDEFGNYTVRAVLKRPGGRHLYALAVCSCGTERHVRIDSLKAGRTLSCGCHQRQAVTRHGQWGHPLFVRWSGMMSRCYNRSDKRYDRYGGRGITVCERWHDVTAFIADMSGTFAPGLTIDRVENDQGYSPENCRWATTAAQNRNYSRNIVLTHDGLSLCLADWATKVGMSYPTLWNRYRQGWAAEKLLTTPVRKLAASENAVSSGG